VRFKARDINISAEAPGQPHWVHLAELCSGGDEVLDEVLDEV
jgi:hypothetical protein